MQNLGDASHILGIEILRERSQCILGLSQRSYIDKVLKKYGMQNSKSGDAHAAKANKFCLKQCP